MEKSVLVLGPVYGIFPTVCEMLDSPKGPEYKIFRFRDDCKWCTGHTSDNPVMTKIAVYSHWEEWDVGQKEGDYRVCKRLEAPPGYRAVVEGTTLPKPKPKAVVPEFDPNIERCEGAIMDAMIADPRMTLYTLKRKTHAERFGKDLWDKCVQNLVEIGEIRLETERGLTSRERIWVVRCDASAPASAPVSAP